MLLSQRSQWLSLALLFGAASAQDVAVNPVTIVVGEDENQIPSSVGWTDGVCYKPIVNSVHPGDTLEFVYEAHNVYQMASKEHFMDCNFTDATLLSQVGESPFRYNIPDDFTGNLFFACQVGDHCASGTQKLQVSVTTFFGSEVGERMAPVSSYLVGVSVDDCQQLQESAANGAIADEQEFMDNQRLLSECSDPVMGEDGYYSRTCLSGPATLTPGGVINRLFVMHYPFPRDHRVAIGQRTFEFVYDNVDGEGVIPAPVNQLYVHHLSGRIVFGQGSEGLRQEAPDAPFPEPYTALSGDEGEFMIFHIIDLREVDDWLSCIECRCPVSSGMTYFDELTQTGNITGGVNCCSNCTDLEGPTLDYRMRYNISYRELDDEPIRDVKMLTADISPVVDKVLEHDVWSSEYLPKEQQAEENPAIQRLERIEPFNQMFKDEFFQQDYSGPDEVQLIRCVAHLHVASIDMWLEDMETGEKLCDGQTYYGKDPETDAGFLIAVNVDTYDPPKTFPADRMVRFVTEYNATQVHTGVMGYWFVFVAGQHDLTHKNVNLTVEMCMQPTCDASMLPTMDMEPFQITPPSDASITARQAGGGDNNNNNNEECVDTLADSPSCTFGGLCDCETFVNAEESSGCDGFYVSPMGDIEVRSVCAKYCGCDVTIAIEEASGAADEGEADCVDTLADSPSCSFGGLCDCETFVNAEESTGCDGVYSSPMGDIEVRSVCANYCGCEGGGTGSDTTTTTTEATPSAPAPAAPSMMGCENKLAESPMCRFANICECEEFVNAPESEGCGGLYKSDMGDVVINDVCAEYCDACVDVPIEALFEEAYMEVMTIQLHEKCDYATTECQAMLSNLYSCASGQPGIEKAHPMIQTVVAKRGQEVALASAQLGDSSLHAGEEPQEVKACAPDAFESSVEDDEVEEEDDSSAAGLLGGLFAALMVFATSSMLL